MAEYGLHTGNLATDLGTDGNKIIPVSDAHPLPGSGGGGGGGAITVADGADVALGTTTQTKATDGSGTSWSVIQLLKGVFNSLLNILSVNLSQVAGTTTSVNTGNADAGTQRVVIVSNQPAVATSRPDMAATTGTITAADASSATTTGLGGQSLITGSPTAGSFVSAAISGAASFSVELTGSWSATVQAEKSTDTGTTWVAVGLLPVGSSVPITSLAGNGVGHGNAAAVTNIRVRCPAASYTSGTVAVRIQPGYGLGSPQTTTIVGSAASGATDAGNPVKTGAVYNSSQPTLTAGQRGDSQCDVNGNQIVDPMRLDSTNDAIQIGQTGTIASVKAASTAAAATDPSLVVALSPNTPARTSALPAGATGSPQTPLVVGANVAAAANNQTLAGTSGKTTYIKGFYVTSLGATAGSTIKITITGLINSQTFTIDFVVPAISSIVLSAPSVFVNFPDPIPASGTNTAIVVNIPSMGTGNTSCSAGAWGFQQ